MKFKIISKKVVSLIEQIKSITLFFVSGEVLILFIMKKIDIIYEVT